MFFMQVGDEILNWLYFHLHQLAKLPSDDMNAVNNMKLLAGADTKKRSIGAFSLKFDIHKVSIW